MFLLALYFIFFLYIKRDLFSTLFHSYFQGVYIFQIGLLGIRCVGFFFLFDCIVFMWYLSCMNRFFIWTWGFRVGWVAIILVCLLLWLNCYGSIGVSFCYLFFILLMTWFAVCSSHFLFLYHFLVVSNDS